MREGLGPSRRAGFVRTATLTEGLCGAIWAIAGSYIADLCCPEAMLIIEVDGSQHGLARDAQRTTALEAEGFMVLRFWNDEVLRDLEAVLLRIEEALTRSRCASPTSPASGRGNET